MTGEEFASARFRDSIGELHVCLRQEVYGLLPMRFYPTEPSWRMWAMGKLVSAADTLGAITTLMHDDFEKDARGLARSLYEQVVTICWLLIDPPANEERLHGSELYELLRLHKFGDGFGETVLDESQVEFAQGKPRMPDMRERSLQVEEHWGSVLKPVREAGHLLSIHGMYLALFQLGSRSTHGALTSLDPFFVQEPSRVVLDRARPETQIFYMLAAAIFGSGLCVAAQRFPCIDEARVREILASQRIIDFRG